MSAPISSVMPQGSWRFDPATLGDPVALKTDWSPLGTAPEAGGSHFELVGDGARGFEFRRRSFSWVPYVIAMILLIAAIEYLPQEFGLDRTALAVVLLVPAAPIALVVLFLRWRRSVAKPPIVFDRNARSLARDGETIRYADLHALQVLSGPRRRSSKGAGVVHHEINLVLPTGRRIPVVKYRKREPARAMARELGSAFGVPVWDVSQERGWREWPG